MARKSIIAYTDPGKGKVYPCEYPTVAAARASVRGPYCRDCRIVIVTARGVEVYERGTGSLKERRVA